MGRIILAFRLFFVALFDSVAGAKIEELLAREDAPAAAPAEPPPPPKPEKKAPVRSEALTLLAALQREARFIDFVQENLEGFGDAEIGAVARDVHRDCGKVLQRMFAVAPAVKEQEGDAVKIPRGFDAGRYRLVGNVAGDPPYNGEVAHHGWEATRLDLPEWSGDAATARVIAPAEVEVK